MIMESRRQFREIGKGFCGSVWTLPESTVHNTFGIAIKREDGGPERSVKKDSDMLFHIAESISKLQHIPFCIPFWISYIDREDITKQAYFQMSAFPEPYRDQPCNALVQEHVRPFKEDVRRRIIDKYCPVTARDRILVNEADQDCLIRPYLGKRRSPKGFSKLNVFSLRNYPLHVEQIEELGLESRLYASIMAETLAILYWVAQVDANDVEFILAPPTFNAKAEQIHHSEFLGTYSLWILDFDCCRHMEMTPVGITQAAMAFLRNDPFFPRPGKLDERDQQNWSIFQEVFLKKSRGILTAEAASLAELWVSEVERVVREL